MRNRELAPKRLSKSTRPKLPHRILLVEADDALRKVNSDALTQLGYVVDAGADGAFAWAALQARHYQLVLTDNDMSTMITGADLVRKMHGARMTSPVIMATEVTPSGNFSERPWLRPAALLLKPYTLAQLLFVVGIVMNPSGLSTRPVPTVTT